MAHSSTVINGLESCTKKNCDICPYGGTVCHGDELLQDALSMLRSLRNHVLTLDEIYQSDFVYIEFNPLRAIVDRFVEPCAVGGGWQKGSVCLLMKDGGIYSYRQVFNQVDYNMMWRCWRDKPTAWEMKHTAWGTNRD